MYACMRIVPYNVFIFFSTTFLFWDGLVRLVRTSGLDMTGLLALIADTFTLGLSWAISRDVANFTA